GQNLKRRRFSGAVRTNQPKDFSRPDVERDPSYGLELAVVLAQIDHAERRSGRGFRCVRRTEGGGIYSDRRFPFGHVPVTRISPSAGMPGFANPVPSFNCSFTPTTCFTRSSRK